MSTSRKSSQASDIHAACQFRAHQAWLDPQYHKDGRIRKPDELEKNMENPPDDIDYKDILDRIHGSMIGMAVGDALGAFVEFRPHAFLVENPVTEMQGGGTWGLKEGQFTDDTSMGLCLANSLVARRNYVPYDQLVRYKWWHQKGYMSSTGSCFDIGAATKQSLVEFERRQKEFSKEHDIPFEQLDFLSDPTLLDKFDANCSKEGVAGNGALMRLAPVPLFFYRDPVHAVKCSGHSGEITHGDEKAYDACRYYGALIVAAVRGASREELFDPNFYEKHKEWFGGKPLHPDIMAIAEGSYQKEDGYNQGIRGKGYIVSALEAALWAFWSEQKSFKEGALAAVNLGDDTDTTAAIYGQLAGAFYGYRKLRKGWASKVYAKGFIECLSKWIAYEGEMWWQRNSYAGNQRRPSKSLEPSQTVQMDSLSISEELVDPKTNFIPRPRRYTIHHQSSLDSNSHEYHTLSHQPSIDKQKQSSRIYIHKNVVTCKDVCNWLKTLGKNYKTYEKIFEDADINGYWLLNHLDDEELIKRGIQNESHRQVILRQIDELRKECPIRYGVAEK